MAPGLQVAQIDGNKWAISARGFNGRFANKLLVLMDGRTLYTPAFSGVFWDVQGTDLETIERIEIIRGPGATLWGSNAVNGVINIITKAARSQAGGSATATFGSNGEKAAAARFGGELGTQSQYRLFVQHQEADGNVDVLGATTQDDWSLQRFGFRLDRRASADSASSIRFEAYDGEMGASAVGYMPTPPYVVVADAVANVSGHHLQGRWERDLSGSKIIFQGVIDHSEREEFAFSTERTTYDLDYQQSLTGSERHNVIFGGTYRKSEDSTTSTFQIAFPVASRDFELFNAFVQDEISISENWALILGSKIERQNFLGSDIEVTPNIRAIKTVDDDTSYWFSVAKAVRTPSRVAQDVEAVVGVLPPLGAGNPLPIPNVLQVVGSRAVRSEEVVAAEFGFRTQLSDDVQVDLAVFRNEYSDLVTFQAGVPRCFPAGSLSDVPPCFLTSPYAIVPIGANNSGSVDTFGIEALFDWQLTDRLALRTTYSWLDESGAFPAERLSNDPKQQLSLRAVAQLGERAELSAMWRYVDSINVAQINGLIQPVESYDTIDLNATWRIANNVQLTLTGKNLLDEAHAEFVSESSDYVPVHIERSVLLRARWSF